MTSWDELTVNQKNELVDSSLSFIATVTEIYGSDEGMVIWDSVSATLGEDARASIFFSMITGASEFKRVCHVRYYPDNQKIALIKLIRVCTNIGLKEAKELSESAKITFKVPHSMIKETRQQLANMGVDYTL